MCFISKLQKWIEKKIGIRWENVLEIKYEFSISWYHPRGNKYFSEARSYLSFIGVQLLDVALFGSWFFFFEILNFDIAFSKALKVPFIWDIRRYPYFSDNILDALKFHWTKILIKIHWTNNSFSCCFQKFMTGIIRDIFTRLRQ